MRVSEGIYPSFHLSSLFAFLPSSLHHSLSLNENNRSESYTRLM
jgi:hypothetical protein